MCELTPLRRFETWAVLGTNSALIAASGREAEARFWEFFIVLIRNPNMRVACARAAAEFYAFAEAGGCRPIRT